MAVSSDILRTWRGPRAVVRDLLAQGQREDRALAYLMAGCVLIFVAQWPRLSRQAFITGAELDQLIAYEFLSWLIIWPLMFYGLAGLSYLAMRLLGLRASAYGARLALFWAWLAATPLGLLYGLLTGFNGADAGSNLIGAGWLLAFGWFWLQGLREALIREPDAEHAD